ncbi:hypothetical protein BUALT_Bualt13G0070300 [Buddleja alternifolia]|uniref:DUF674 domain-containing protein n=1 Tax=Buddleja alternifolia TaxID=168488 RepID=A0AAV6WSL9_9LAMI|nr:hypothetical protein BUALT_Bualt13G0070300 [Buddleja alternifolia]
MATSTVSMKLLIDAQSKRVLFAEAGKDCVDFLFHILAMPVSNVISLLKKQGMVGSLANLCINNVSDDPRAICPNCNREMTRNVTYVVPPPLVGNKACDEGGFVKGVVTYMIMDNLEVKPMSTISSITLLNKFNVKDVGELEEKVVNLGMNEAVKLLKASLQSKNVLTDVFLKGK